MEDDNHGRKSQRRSCGRHCDQARRLMRVSTTLPLAESGFKHGHSDDRKERGTPQPEELSNTTKKAKKNPCDEKPDCDDEYMLQNLHKLKCFIRRVWNYAWCYTQYCYPALRTVEYYKKVKRVCTEKEKVEKKRKKKEKADRKKKGKKPEDLKDVANKKSLIGPLLMSTEAANNSLLMMDSSTQTSDEWSDDDVEEFNEDDDSSPDRKKRHKPMSSKHSFNNPLNIVPPLDEKVGWWEHLLKRFRRPAQSVLDLIDQTDQEYQTGAIIKIMCLILGSAVIWLGANYIFLKKKYKSLSGKLRKIKEENDILKKESSKLESMLTNTEKLKMPFSTKESRQQVVAEFTRLAESRMKSKKEITRLTTEKQALLEELKTAKRQREVARNQYSCLTQGELETNESPYLKT